MKSNRKRSTLFLLPSILGTMILFVLPFGVVVFFSVVSSPVNGHFVGFENYIDLFRNTAFQLAAKNTALMCGISVPLAVILALLMAILLSPEMPGRSVFQSVFLSPLFVPVASVVMIFRIMFHQNGMLNEFLSQCGIDPINFLQSDWSRCVVILLYLWKNLGYNMILFMAALAGVPKEILEAVQLDGGGKLRQFFSVKLYYISPTVLFVTILSLISSMRLFREVYLLAGAYPYQDLYLLQHFMNNTFLSMNYQKLCSAAIVLSMCMITVIGGLFILEARLGKDLENT